MTARWKGTVRLIRIVKTVSHPFQAGLNICFISDPYACVHVDRHVVLYALIPFSLSFLSFVAFECAADMKGWAAGSNQ